MSVTTAALHEMVERERRRFGVPGCAVVVVAGGEVLMRAGFGLRDVDRGLPVTEDTLFPIGSSTKTFTAALCAGLADDGLLDWRRPVREYLPGFAMADATATEQLTVVDLLAHRSGLPRHDLLWYADDGAMDRAALIAAMAELPPNLGFRERWQYNNIGYAAAGELAGRLSGGGFERAVRDRLLDPLGMRRTTFTIVQTRADPDHAEPYLHRDGTPVAVPFASLDLIGAAGNINSSVRDLTGWLLTLLGRGVAGAPPLLSPAALARLRTPVVPLPAGSLLTVHRAVGYALGLIVEDYGDHRVVAHGGDIDGFAAQVSTIPDADCGVAVLTNRGGSALRDALPFVLYDALLGRPASDHGGRLLTLERALTDGRNQQRPAEQPATRLPAVRPLIDYLGDYHHPAYGTLRIEETTGRAESDAATGTALTARYGRLSGPLRHRHLEVFDLVLDLDGVPTPLPLQFTHDLDGAVDAACCQLEPTLLPIRFRRVPRTETLTDETLDRWAGEYRLGPLTATISRRSGRRLIARIVEGDPVELEYAHDAVFHAGAARVEFTTDGRLLTRFGEFVRDTG